MQFLTNLNLNGNQLLGLRLEVLASDPAGGGLYEGRLWFNSTDNLLKYYDGTQVVELGVAETGGVASLTVDDSSIENTGTGGDPILRVKALGITNAMLAGSIALAKLATDPLARANHTGTQAASTISDLATVVKAYTLDEFADPVADINLNSHKITNLTNPTSAQDAATKAYVDSVAAGLAPKDAVRAATTGNVTLASGFENGDTIDGVTLATGDRILVKNQSAPAENGIYVVAASGAPVRATDADAQDELIGAAVFVSEGTVNGNTLWVMTTNAPITVDTTGLVWAQFGGPGAYTAGTGLTLTGTTFALDTPVSVAHGGTGATDTAGVKTALGFVTKYAALIGDGSATDIAVSHALGTRDVIVTVYDAATYEVVHADVEHTSTNVVTISFAVAPDTDEYRVVVVG